EVARRGHAEVVAQAPARPAVVRDGDDRAHVIRIAPNGLQGRRQPMPPTERDDVHITTPATRATGWQRGHGWRVGRGPTPQRSEDVGRDPERQDPRPVTSAPSNARDRVAARPRVARREGPHAAAKRGRGEGPAATGPAAGLTTAPA